MFDTRRVVRRIALFVVVAVVVVVAVATLPGVAEVRARLRAAEPGWIGAAAAFELGSVLAFVVTLHAAFDRVIPLRRALDLGLAEQGANVLLPAGGTGGPALGTFVMRRAGVPTEIAAERHVALFLITSAVGFTSLVLFGTLVAVGVLPGTVGLGGTVVPALVGLAVLGGAAAFSRTDPGGEPAAVHRLRHGVWRLRGFLRDGVATSLALLRERDPRLIGGAVAYYAFDVAALAAAFAAFGGEAPPLGPFVLAYTIGHAGAFLPTPGGVGGTDGGLIAAFAAYGTPLGLATAAVLSYRVFQLGLPTVLGAVGLLRVRRRLREPGLRETVAARWQDIDLPRARH